MRVRPLDIAGAYEVTPVRHDDDRGSFSEWYRADVLDAAGAEPFDLQQGNLSVSRRGVVRGIHYADLPLGQAKYVTCVAGSVIDLVIDVRTGSPTFGAVTAVELDDVDRRAVFLEEGLGHAFVATSETAVVCYLVSRVYDPTREHGVTPLDPDLGLDRWIDPAAALLSPKDQSAPTLREAAARGLLPSYADTPSGRGM